MTAIFLDEVAQKGLDGVSELSSLFVADSGVSVHMTGDLAGMTNLRDCNVQVKIANGGLATATKIGDKKCHVFDKKGEKHNMTLAECECVPDLGTLNLWSLTKGLNNGHSLGNKGKFITMKKGNFKLVFDEEVKTRNGYVCGVKVHHDEPEDLWQQHHHG